MNPWTKNAYFDNEFSCFSRNTLKTWNGISSDLNQPCFDGNERTGYALMCMIIRRTGKDIQASGKEKYDLAIGVAPGNSKTDQFYNWINSKLKSI